MPAPGPPAECVINISEGGDDAAEQVEEQVVPLTDAVFHALTKNVQEGHVAKDVTKRTMQKHGRENGADGPANCTRVTAIEGHDEIVWHEQVGREEFVAVSRDKHSYFPKKRYNVCQDEPESDRCRVEAAKVIF